MAGVAAASSADRESMYNNIIPARSLCCGRLEPVELVSKNQTCPCRLVLSTTPHHSVVSPVHFHLSLQPPKPLVGLSRRSQGGEARDPVVESSFGHDRLLRLPTCLFIYLPGPDWSWSSLAWTNVAIAASCSVPSRTAPPSHSFHGLTARLLPGNCIRP